MTNEELSKHVEKVLQEVYEPDGTTVNYDKAKEYICSFYEGHKNCIGCKKAEHKLEECTSDYATNIVDRPQEKWSPDWDKVITREKTPFSDLTEVGLNCDRCYLSDTCPMFQKKATCAIDWGTNIHTLKPEKAIEAVIQIQDQRVQRARAIELMDGGVPDQNLSAEIDRLHGLIALKADMESDKFSLKIEATAKNSGGSILEKFFGGGMKSNNELPNNQSIQIEEGSFVELPVRTANDAVPEPRERSKTPRKVSRKSE